METEPAVTPTSGEDGPPTAASAQSNVTLKEIIGSIRKRRGRKQMPSTVQRHAERRKRRRTNSMGDGSEAGTLPEVDEVPRPPRLPEVEEEPETEVVAPQTIIDEDGNIVVDQQSLVVSTGGGSGEGERTDVTTYENYEYGGHITSATYSKRESATRWEDTETMSFYEALRKYGSDFSVLESVLPGRSRRQLKLKFKREEREYPEKIDAALNGQHIGGKDNPTTQKDAAAEKDNAIEKDVVVEDNSAAEEQAADDETGASVDSAPVDGQAAESEADGEKEARCEDVQEVTDGAVGEDRAEVVSAVQETEGGDEGGVEQVIEHGVEGENKSGDEKEDEVKGDSDEEEGVKDTNGGNDGASGAVEEVVGKIGNDEDEDIDNEFNIEMAMDSDDSWADSDEE